VRAARRPRDDRARNEAGAWRILVATGVAGAPGQLRRGRATLSQQPERLTEAYLARVMRLAEYERRRRDADARLQALDRQEHELAHDAERQGETAGLAA
jgi:hypothetical protein